MAGSIIGTRLSTTGPTYISGYRPSDLPMSQPGITTRPTVDYGFKSDPTGERPEGDIIRAGTRSDPTGTRNTGRPKPTSNPLNADGISITDLGSDDPLSRNSDIPGPNISVNLPGSSTNVTTLPASTSTGTGSGFSLSSLFANISPMMLAIVGGIILLAFALKKKK